MGCVYPIGTFSTDLVSRDIVVLKFGTTTTLHQCPKEEIDNSAVHTAVMGFVGFVASNPDSSFLVGSNWDYIFPANLCKITQCPQMIRNEQCHHPSEIIIPRGICAISTEGMYSSGRDSPSTKRYLTSRIGGHRCPAFKRVGIQAISTWKFFHHTIHGCTAYVPTHSQCNMRS